jgi:hypothetical protein
MKLGGTGPQPLRDVAQDRVAACPIRLCIKFGHAGQLKIVRMARGKRDLVGGNQDVRILSLVVVLINRDELQAAIWKEGADIKTYTVPLDFCGVRDLLRKVGPPRVEKALDARHPAPTIHLPIEPLVFPPPLGDADERHGTTASALPHPAHQQ